MIKRVLELDNKIFNVNERRKRKQTLENYSGSWRLFTVLVVHPTSHDLTLPHTSYADK